MYLIFSLTAASCLNHMSPIECSADALVQLDAYGHVGFSAVWLFIVALTTVEHVL